MIYMTFFDLCNLCSGLVFVCTFIKAHEKRVNVILILILLLWRKRKNQEEDNGHMHTSGFSVHKVHGLKKVSVFNDLSCAHAAQGKLHKCTNPLKSITYVFYGILLDKKPLGLLIRTQGENPTKGGITMKSCVAQLKPT